MKALSSLSSPSCESCRVEIQMKYYPIYLDLKDRAVLVVGGGAIAEGKAEQLIEARARACA